MHKTNLEKLASDNPRISDSDIYKDLGNIFFLQFFLNNFSNGAKSMSTMPVISDDSESSAKEHKQYVRSFNNAARVTVTGGAKLPVAGLIVNKNLIRGVAPQEKVSEGGRRQLFVPMISELLRTEEMGDTVDSKFAFVKALRSKEKPLDFLSKLASHFFSENEDIQSNFEIALHEMSIKIKATKPEYGKRKCMNLAVTPATMKIVTKEVEEPDDMESKEMYEEVFVNEDVFFERFVNELDKADAVEEELKSYVRVSRKPSSIAEDDEDENDDFEDKVKTICEVFEHETKLEKSKAARVFKESNSTLTLCFRNPLLQKKLQTLGIPKIKFQPGETHSGSKPFTREDSAVRTGVTNTITAQFVGIKLSKLAPEMREKVLHIFDDKGYTYQDELENEAEAVLSQSSQNNSQPSQNITLKRFCKYCNYSCQSRPEMEEHIASTHKCCTICKKMFKDGNDLEKHMTEHKKSKCKKCGKTVTITGLERHMEQHKDMDKREYSKVKKTSKKNELDEIDGKKQKKNPYFSFCKDERPKVKADHPLYNMGQVNSELGRRWRELKEEERQVYRDGLAEAGAAAGHGDVAGAVEAGGVVQQGDAGGGVEAGAVEDQRGAGEVVIEDSEEDVEEQEPFGNLEELELSLERRRGEEVAQQQADQDSDSGRNTMTVEVDVHQTKVSKVIKTPMRRRNKLVPMHTEDILLVEEEDTEDDDSLGESDEPTTQKLKTKKVPETKKATVDFVCPLCETEFEDVRKLKVHMDKYHKQKQATLNMSGQILLKPPMKPELIVCKPSGKLLWPGQVISRSGTNVTVKMFNKLLVIKTLPEAKTEPFDLEKHKKEISQKNAEHKNAFKIAKSMMEY